MSHNLRVALALAAQGIAVFPVQNAPGTEDHKKPYPRFWWKSKSTTVASTIEAWWRLYPDAMPAVDCGKSGLLVVDLDTPRGKSKADGLAAWAKLAAGREPSCPTVETPSGGRHLVFRQPSPALGNRKGGLPKGVDIRGAGGYVVAPGARCSDGTEYRLTGELSSASASPEWLIDIIRGGKPKPESPPAPAAAASPQPSTADPDRIRDALRHIPADDREIWLNVGMAIKSEQGATGWGLWRDWSMTSDKWDERDGQKVWRSIQPEGGITIGTLFGLAQDHGWHETPARDPAQEARGAELARSLMRTKEGDLIDTETGEIVAEAQPEQLQDPERLPDHLTRPPGLVGDIVEWIVATARYPSRTMALAAALLVVGTAVGRDRAGPTNSATHLYGLVLAPTGTGKAHPMEQAARLLQASGMSANIGPSDFKSGAGVVSLLARSPLSLCCMDEFGALMRRINDRYSGPHARDITRVLRMVWGKSFAPLVTDEGGSKQAETIQAPALSILGASTEEEFYQSLGATEVLNGFLNRFLMAVEPDRRPEQEPVADPFHVPPMLASRLAYLSGAGGNLKGLTQTNITPRRVPWADTEAKAVYDGITCPNGEVAPYYTRTREMAVRVATILACGIDPDAAVITADVMAWGRDLALYSAATMVRGVGAYVAETETQQQAKEVERIVRAAGAPIGHRELCQKLKHKYRASLVKELLATLLESGAIQMDRIVHGPSGGRPTMVYSAGVAG
jgi:hypothetical protein